MNECIRKTKQHIPLTADEIAALVRGLLKYKGVQAFLGGVRPCVVALILATAATMALSVLFGIKEASGGAKTDVKAILILALLGVITIAADRLFKKKTSPIIMIMISAVLGMVLYSLPDF